MIDLESLRMVEAILFAADKPLSIDEIAAFLPEGTELEVLLGELAASYEPRGVNLVERGGRWLFQTAPDLAHILSRERPEARKLSRAALETLAIIAYHEPATRGQIEEIRGVSISRGTIDVLMEAGWIRPAGRRESPGRPLQFATTPAFLVQFGLTSRRDLPGIAELKAAGLLDPIDLSMTGQPRPDGEDDQPELELDADEFDHDSDEESEGAD